MSDDRFELELRDFLRSREPSAATERLRARIAGVPSAERRTPRWERIRGLSAAAAVLVAALALGAVLVVRGQLGPGPNVAAPPTLLQPAEVGPFLKGTDSLFSPDAIADAEDRLAAVYAATGVEARLIIVDVPDRSSLTVPEDWSSETYGRDGSDDRDVVAILGVDPEGGVVCCLTRTGPAITGLMEPWRPLQRIDQLKGKLEQDSIAVRDEALERFVASVERLGPLVTAREQELAGTGWIVPAAASGLVLALAAWVLVRRRGRPSPAAEAIEVVEADVGVMTSPPTPQSVGAAGSADIHGPVAPVAWARPTEAGRLDTRVIAALTALGFILFLALAFGEGLGFASGGAALDPSIDGQGLVAATPGPSLPVVPLLLGAAVALGLGVLVWRLGRVARVVGAIGVAVALWVAWAITVNGFVWLDRDRATTAWADGLGFGSSETSTSLPFTYTTYPVGPGEPVTFAFTIENHGPLPISVLGAGEEPWIDGVRTVNNAFRITGLAHLGSSTSGPPDRLSARPADATVAWPVRLAPGERLVVVALGRGGPCAAGAPVGPDGSTSLTSVRIAYRVMGWTTATDVATPAVVLVPQDFACPGDS